MSAWVHDGLCVYFPSAEQLETPQCRERVNHIANCSLDARINTQLDLPYSRWARQVGRHPLRHSLGRDHGVGIRPVGKSCDFAAIETVV